MYGGCRSISYSKLKTLKIFEVQKIYFLRYICSIHLFYKFTRFIEYGIWLPCAEIHAIIHHGMLSMVLIIILSGMYCTAASTWPRNASRLAADTSLSNCGQTMLQICSTQDKSGKDECHVNSSSPSMLFAVVRTTCVLALSCWNTAPGHLVVMAVPLASQPIQHNFEESMYQEWKLDRFIYYT